MSVEWVDLLCPICGALMWLPEEERDGDSVYALIFCDECDLYGDEDSP